MSKNDYFVIVYKILLHLYDSLKNGRNVNWNELQPNSRVFPIDEAYWEYIWLNLMKDGYVTGVAEIPRLGAEPGIKILPSLRITPKGIEYLEENSMMKKISSGIRDLADLITNVI